jgi:poly(3-hydroxybutyrate) depolymerase
MKVRREHKFMRIREASACIAVLFAGLGSIGCGGDDPECTGAAFTGGPIACGMAGTFDRTVCVEGKVRHFREYVPDAVTCDGPPPLIVFLHGNGGNETSGDVACAVADELGAVYVSLRGYDQGGYLGFGPEGIPSSRAFLTMVVDDVRREFPTDSQFALLTGFSAGGFFASYCITWLNDRLAGVGIFGAGIAENWMAEFAAAPAKVPVLVRVGDADSLQSYADSLVLQLKSSGWPDERIDSQRFAGGHTWSPEMIRDAFRLAKSFSRF